MISPAQGPNVPRKKAEASASPSSPACLPASHSCAISPISTWDIARAIRRISCSRSGSVRRVSSAHPRPCRIGLSEDWLKGLSRSYQTTCSIPSQKIPSEVHSTLTFTATDGMPFATTSNVLAPISMFVGMSNWADTIADPVATPMLLKA